MLFRSKIIIHSDSRLVVEQFLGNYDITKPHLLELYKTAKQIEPECKYTLKWIPREQNKELMSYQLLEEILKGILNIYDRLFKNVFYFQIYTIYLQSQNYSIHEKKN